MNRETNLSPELPVDELMSYQRMIFSTAKKYLGKQYASWALDITQDVLLKACKNGDHYNPSKGSLSNWLYTMTKNACFDLMNKKVNKSVLLTNEEYIISSNESDERLCSNSMKSTIRIALNELQYRDRTILIMRFYFNCSVREIAEFLEIPEKNMASYMKRAKERLKGLLDYAQAA
jgi:RNA polymerase sigma-70 factor (ECF subfamily)